MVRTRLVLVVSMAALLLALSASSASAFCPVEPLRHLIRGSDAVWWGTVTDASAARSGHGTWELTVHLDDVLKGPGTVGDSATVVTWSCGPYISPAEAASSAPSFVGQQGLFFGTLYESGALDDYAGIVSPQPKSPQDEYRMAVSDLGLTPVSAVPPAQVPPTLPAPVPSSPQPFVAFVVVALLIALIAAFASRRNRT